MRGGRGLRRQTGHDQSGMVSAPAAPMTFPAPLRPSSVQAESTDRRRDGRTKSQKALERGRVRERPPPPTPRLCPRQGAHNHPFRDLDLGPASSGSWPFQWGLPPRSPTGGVGRSRDLALTRTQPCREAWPPPPRGAEEGPRPRAQRWRRRRDIATNSPALSSGPPLATPSGARHHPFPAPDRALVLCHRAHCPRTFPPRSHLRQPPLTPSP